MPNTVRTFSRRTAASSASTSAASAGWPASCSGDMHVGVPSSAHDIARAELDES